MKYSVIYLDPPWVFKTYSDKGKGKSPDNHYTCMSLDNIQALDIKSIAEKDCVLICWVLSSMLPEALETITSWGFKFKTVVFNWTKTVKDGSHDNFGMGYYSRQNTEICLLATRGKGLKVKSHSVRQQISTAKEAHSKKPECVRDRLNELFGFANTIELFARPNFMHTYTNWRFVGNEIDGKDIVEALKEIANE